VRSEVGCLYFDDASSILYAPGPEGDLKMEITDVRVFPVDEEKLKAYVTITLDNCFVIRDLKVIHGSTGLFIAMPAKRRKDGTYKDIAHPLNTVTRVRMEKVILLEYERQKNLAAASSPREEAEMADGE
jgi:stage V sporulation protein G